MRYIFKCSNSYITHLKFPRQQNDDMQWHLADIWWHLMAFDNIRWHLMTSDDTWWNFHDKLTTNVEKIDKIWDRSSIVNKFHWNVIECHHVSYYVIKYHQISAKCHSTIFFNSFLFSSFIFLVFCFISIHIFKFCCQFFSLFSTRVESTTFYGRLQKYFFSFGCLCIDVLVVGPCLSTLIGHYSETSCISHEKFQQIFYVFYPKRTLKIITWKILQNLINYHLNLNEIDCQIWQHADLLEISHEKTSQKFFIFLFRSVKVMKIFI